MIVHFETNIRMGLSGKSKNQPIQNIVGLFVRKDNRVYRYYLSANPKNESVIIKSQSVYRAIKEAESYFSAGMYRGLLRAKFSELSEALMYLGSNYKMKKYASLQLAVDDWGIHLFIKRLKTLPPIFSEEDAATWEYKADYDPVSEPDIKYALRDTK